MNTDNNQNKHLTELSDEELKNVNGGLVRSITDMKEAIDVITMRFGSQIKFDVADSCPEEIDIL